MSESETQNSVEMNIDGESGVQTEVAENSSENVETEVSSDTSVESVAEPVPEKPRAQKSLKVNFIFNFLSQILTIVLPLVTAPYVSRVLHEDGIGQYSYAASIITYFTLFANLGFDIYGQRQVARYQDDIEKKSKIFWEILIIRAGLTVISLAVLYSILFSIGFGETYNKLILISSLSVIGVPFDIQFIFRGDEDFRSLAIRTILVKLILIACIFIFVKSSSDVWIYALCSIGITTLSNLMLWPALRKRIKCVKIKNLSLKNHLLPSFVIFLPTLATTVYSVFDKTMIGLFAKNPDYENGCYEQAYKINNVALILVVVISSIMTSRNAHDYAKGDTESLKRHLYFSSSYVWMMGIPLIVGFAVLSGNLSSWFLGDGYEAVPILLQVMSVRFVVSGFGEIFGNQLFIAIGKEKYCTIAATSAAGLNLLLNFLLIGKLGALGAAIATAACEIFVTMLLAIFARKGKFISFRRVLLLSWKNIIAAGVMFVPIFFMQKYLGNGIWQFFVIMTVGVIVYGLMLFVLRDSFFLNNVKSVIGAIKRKLFRTPATIAVGGEQGLAPTTEIIGNSGEDNNEQTD